jgi:hypothetical protein
VAKEWTRRQRLALWWMVYRPLINRRAFFLVGLIVGVGYLALMTVMVGGADDVVKDGFRVVAPVVAIIWAMFLPWVQRREANNRRFEERQEMRIVAAQLSRMAHDEIQGVIHGLLRYASESGAFPPHRRFNDLVETLGQFKADKLPDAKVLVALENIRSLLRRAETLMEDIDPANDGMLPSQAMTVAEKLDGIMMQVEVHAEAIMFRHADVGLHRW